MRDNLRITTEDGHDLTLRDCLGVREDTAASNVPLLNITAKPPKGEWSTLVTNVAPRIALETYRKRWAVECLFGAPKPEA